MSKHGRFEQQKPKKRLTGGKIALIVVAVLLIIVIAAVIFGVVYYNSMLNKIPRAEHVANSVSQEDIDAIMNYNPDAPVGTTTETQAPTTEPTTVPTTLPYTPSSENITNVLVVGQASRDGEEYHMADTMILVTINRDTKVLTLTSFLRDTFLKLPDYKDLSGRQHTCGKQRLNVCYHLGYTFGGTADAMLMLNQCLKENFGINVDYNLEIDFEAFAYIVDYFGGIDIELTQAEADYLNADDFFVKYDVAAGVQKLDGWAALSYARMRKAEGDNDSDIKRTERQKKLIQELFKHLKAMDLFGMQTLVTNCLERGVITNMTNDDITTCIWEFLPIMHELTIESGTCPVSTTYWGEIVDIGGYPSSVLKFDEGQNRKLMMALTEGTE